MKIRQNKICKMANLKMWSLSVTKSTIDGQLINLHSNSCLTSLLWNNRLHCYCWRTIIWISVFYFVHSCKSRNRRFSSYQGKYIHPIILHRSSWWPQILSFHLGNGEMIGYLLLNSCLLSIAWCGNPIIVIV